MIIFYVGTLGVTSPVKTASILISLCGFFHGCGFSLAMGLSGGLFPTGKSDMINALVAYCLSGIFVAIAYLVVGFILSGLIYIINDSLQ
jgi:hypothetical protein